VSEYDRRDLNQELRRREALDPAAMEDQRPEHDGKAIGFIEGVMVRSHPDVPRGKARLVSSRPRSATSRTSSAARA
jgi:hypothetical protein